MRVPRRRRRPLRAAVASVRREVAWRLEARVASSFARADARASQTLSAPTTRTSARPRTSPCSVGDDKPDRAAIAGEHRTAGRAGRDHERRVDVFRAEERDVDDVSVRIGRGARPAASQARGTGRMPSIADGWTRTTATSRDASATITAPVTFTDGETCTSTDCRVANGAEARRDEPALIGQEAGGVCEWRPEPEGARLPRGQNRRPCRTRRIRRPRPLRGSIGRRRADGRVGRGQLERRVAPRDDVDRLAPIRSCVHRGRRGDRIRRCSCPAAGGSCAVPSGDVTTRRGGAVTGLSLMSSACRATGIGRRSASSTDTLRCRTGSSCAEAPAQTARATSTLITARHMTRPTVY